MLQSYPMQVIAEIRRAQQRCPIYNPLMCTAAAASILGMTQAQLRYRHRDLADKSAHGRLRWWWSDVEHLFTWEAVAEARSLAREGAP